MSPAVNVWVEVKNKTFTLPFDKYSKTIMLFCFLKHYTYYKLISLTYDKWSWVLSFLVYPVFGVSNGNMY